MVFTLLPAMIMLFFTRRLLLLSRGYHLIATTAFLSSSITNTILPSKAAVAVLSSSSNTSTTNTTTASFCTTSSENNNRNTRGDMSSNEICNNNNNNILSTMYPIGLGTFMIDRDQIPSILRSAIIHSGYRRIDCAPVYFNEDMIGNTIETLILQQHIKRDDLFIVSKLPSPFHTNPEIAIRKTLNDLKLQYLDLYLIHWPVAFQPVPIDPNKRGWDNEDIDDSNNGLNIDLNVSIHDTWILMESLVEKGLVKYIGVSNFPVILLHELLSRKHKIMPYVNQCECHPYLQQTKLIEYCTKRGIHFQAYSPLGASREYRSVNEPIILNDPIIIQMATKYNVSTAIICLAWAIQRGYSVVTKSMNEQHLYDNIKQTMEVVPKLTNDDMDTISKLDRNYRYFRPEDWWKEMPLAVFN